MPPKHSRGANSTSISDAGRRQGGEGSRTMSPSSKRDVSSASAEARSFSASSTRPMLASPLRTAHTQRSDVHSSPGSREQTAGVPSRVSSSGGGGGRGVAGATHSGKRLDKAGETASSDADGVSRANDNVATIPSEEQLMQTERLHLIAEQLSRSLVILRSKLSVMEQRISRSSAAVEAGTGRAGGVALSPSGVPLLPFQVRRAEQEKEQLEKEIAHTSRTIRKLLIMTQQMEGVMAFKDVVFRETRAELEAEIAALQAEKRDNLDTVREGFVSRINLLHRYWPWRQLLDLGDTSVGGTFEEELKRGPRYRNVGIQNSIESDYIETQLRWLQQLSQREDTFRNHLRRLDALVEDLHDINDLLESTLTCKVCDLLLEDPVLFWPCGHTFCLACFESLTIAPSLFRCPMCGSIGSEGYVHNLLIGEVVAKWMFKDAGYGDLPGQLSNIRVHLSRFRKDRMEERIESLKALLKKFRAAERAKAAEESKTITISYRAY